MRIYNGRGVLEGISAPAPFEKDGMIAYKVPGQALPAVIHAAVRDAVLAPLHMSLLEAGKNKRARETGKGTVPCTKFARDCNLDEFMEGLLAGRVAAEN